MPIVFRCNNCERKLSVSRRKAGTESTCPECGSVIRIPGGDDGSAEAILATQTVSIAPNATVDQAVGNNHRKSALLLTIIAAALIAAVSLPLFVLSMANRGGQSRQQPEKSASPVWDEDIDRIAYHRPASSGPARRNPNPADRVPTRHGVPRDEGPTAKPASSAAATTLSKPGSGKTTGKETATKPQIAVKKEQPSATTIPAVAKSNPSKVKPGSKRPVPPKTQDRSNEPRQPVLVLNPFGNPINRNVGLALDGEFKGKKLLVWGGFRREVNVFLGTNNPLWAALRKKGFDVAIRTGPFDRRWLLQADQLWIFSSPTKDPYELVAAANLDLVVGLMPESALPPGWTKNDMAAVFRACLRYPGGVFNLSPRDCLAVRNFVRSGKGLFLLAENDPATHEAKLLGRMLFGTTVSGNYKGTRIAFVKERGLPPELIRKYGGQYPVDDHPLLKGVNFIFEGVTVSTFRPTESLHVVMPASDGKPLVGVSKIPGQRIVLDCGYTRYYFGPTPASQFIVRTAGTIRFAENVAAYLMGKGQQ